MLFKVGVNITFNVIVNYGCLIVKNFSAKKLFTFMFMFVIIRNITIGGLNNDIIVYVKRLLTAVYCYKKVGSLFI